MDFNKPRPLEVNASNLAKEWERWKELFNDFLIASDKDKKDKKVKASILRNLIGPDALVIYETFTLTEDEKADCGAIIAKFEEYCKPKVNIVYERFKFWNTKQNDMSLDEYVIKLKSLAKDCAFDDPEQNTSSCQVRDKFVAGMSDIRTQERLLREPKLTLERAIEIAKTAALSQKQAHEIQNRDEELPVDTIKKATSGKITECDNCGYSHPIRACPAWGKTCKKCSKLNHFASRCRGGQRFFKSGTPARGRGRPRPQAKKFYTVEYDEEDDEDELFCGSLAIDGISSDNEEKQWWQEIIIRKVSTPMKIDTGAEGNVMPLRLYHSLNNPGPLQKRRVKLRSYGNFKIDALGVSTIPVECNGKIYSLEFAIADVNSCPVIGLPSCKMMNLVKRVDPSINVESVSQINSVAQSNDLLKQYNDVFTGLGKIGTYSISLKEDATPVIHPPRKVPLSLHDKLRETLDDLEKREVISKVSYPTDWVNSLVIVEKKNKSLRLCLDPRSLNNAIRREHYCTPSPEYVASKLASKKVFSIVDLKDSFWQICLDEQSSDLCVFNTPFGRYKFLRMPFGIKSASEVIQKRLEQIFGDIDNVQVIHDDIIVAGDDDEQHDQAMTALLERAREYRVTFNLKKLQYKVKQVKYMGHIYSADGMSVDPDKVQAVENIPKPTCVKDVQRLIGTVNYLSKFIPNLSDILLPMRSILKKGNAFLWTHEHDDAFNKIKKVLISDPVLKFFNPEKPVLVQSDASQTGLGAVLLQDDHPVAYASRALTPAESNYAPIERELLSVLFACEKFHTYVYGRNFDFENDHQPLESIVRQPLSQTPPRLQRMLLSLQKYDFTLNYKPGKTRMVIPDELSRAVLALFSDDNPREQDVQIMINTIFENLPVSNDKLNTIKAESASDSELSILIKYLRQGWPKYKANLPQGIQQYWAIKSELYIEKGVIFKGDRIVIPRCLRREMLERIHGSHLGIEKCKNRARQILYWPNMSVDIENYVLECSICMQHRPRNQKEKLLPHEVPAYPWQKLGADIFTIGSVDYLLVVDYFSKYPEVARLKSKDAPEVIRKLKEMFSRQGIPSKLSSDNVPFNSRKMRLFAREWDFSLSFSSPGYPQSNGQSERAIQTVKKLIIKAHESSKDVELALLDYRTSPLKGCDKSPAELLMGRRLKNMLPVKEDLLKPPSTERDRSMLLRKQEKEKAQFDVGARDMEVLQKGQRVRFRLNGKWVGPGIISKKLEDPRSYLVKWNGKELRRNRIHLLKTQEKTAVANGFDPIDDDTCTDTFRNVPPLQVQGHPRLRDRARHVRPPRRLIEEV